MIYRSRAERQKIYRSKRWAKTRRSALDRDGWRCCQCGRAGALEVDHVVPMDRGGDPWSLMNLQSLCRACHYRKTGGENRGRKPSKPPEVQAWRELVDRMQRAENKGRSGLQTVPKLSGPANQ